MNERRTGLPDRRSFHADIARNSAMINVHMLETAQINAAKRFLFSSSACVYPMYLQTSPDVTNLKEDDAYPAEPEEGYGTEKLFMEELCKHYYEDYGFETRVVRFHNVYGLLGTYEGGKEKAPAAISRKVALAANGDEIEVWGDGEQTRSSMHVDDCVEGIRWEQPVSEVECAPLYRRPRKIWGIGLNYAEHAEDLDVVSPSDEPASFMRPDTAITGPGEDIRLPGQSGRVTTEAELAVIVGRVAKDVPEREVPSVVAGFTTVLDMTAEDMLRRNPRYLTRANGFDTFFSVGPHLGTPDEVGEVGELEVATVLNDEVRRENTVSNTIFSLWFLISFHSKGMTLLPGDVISTGTPGAVEIRDGDVVRCRISSMEPLSNPVRR